MLQRVSQLIPISSRSAEEGTSGDRGFQVGLMTNSPHRQLISEGANARGTRSHTNSAARDLSPPHPTVGGTWGREEVVTLRQNASGQEHERCDVLVMTAG